jgi:hypothetical protein
MVLSLLFLSFFWGGAVVHHRARLVLSSRLTSFIFDLSRPLGLTFVARRGAARQGATTTADGLPHEVPPCKELRRLTFSKGGAILLSSSACLFVLRFSFQWCNGICLELRLLPAVGSVHRPTTNRNEEGWSAGMRGALFTRQGCTGRIAPA